MSYQWHRFTRRQITYSEFCLLVRCRSYQTTGKKLAHSSEHNSQRQTKLSEISIFYISIVYSPRSGELRTQKLKSHLVRTQSLNVLPLKPGVGQCIAIHATLTARDFFLAYFYPSGPFACIFSKTSPDFCCVGCG